LTVCQPQSIKGHPFSKRSSFPKDICHYIF